MHKDYFALNQIEAPCPILAIHGSASDGDLWRPLKRRYTGARMVLNPTLSGYDNIGSSSFQQHSTLAERARPLVELISNLEEDIHLVAHSFGASVAMEIIRLLPDRVRSFTAYEPVVPALLRDSGNNKDLELLGDLMALAQIVNGTSAKVGMETFINFWGNGNIWQNLTHTTQARLSALAPIVYQDFMEATSNLKPKAMFEIAYSGPIKILMGSGALNHTKQMTANLQRLYPQTSLEILTAIGHMAPLTDPTKVFSAMAKHIEHVDTSVKKRGSNYVPNSTGSMINKHLRTGGHHEIF